MKTSLKLTSILSALAFVLVLNIVSSAQMRVGGYKSIAADDAGAVAAAEFAVEAQGKKEDAEITFESIVKAESQVVQGTNFRLCMEVTIGRADEDVAYQQWVKVIVYRNLKQEFSLTSWTEEDCAEE